MTTIVTRAGKGSPLTNTEMDTNLTNLNTDKVDVVGNQTIAGIKTFSSPVGVAAAVAAGDAVMASQIVVNSVSPASMVRVHTANGYGSTNTKIRRFTTVLTNQGTDITYADSATLGGSFTVNTSGVYAITWTEMLVSANLFGISLDSAALTTNIEAQAASAILAVGTANGSGIPDNATAIAYLPSGSVIRAHGDGAASSGGAVCHFIMTRVS